MSPRNEFPIEIKIDAVTPGALNDEFVLYPKRWWVLGSFSLLSTSSAWIWITWSPIASLVADMWGVDAAAVDALSGIFMYIYVGFSFLSLYLVVNYIGLHKGLCVGGTFNLIGAFLRYRYYYDYHTVYIGTVICAVAQTFTLSTPPLIAGNWFGFSERATATALGVLANQLGTAIGLGSTILVDFTDHDIGNTKGHSVLNVSRLEHYLELQLGVAALALLLVVVCGANQPATPPSKAAALAHYSARNHNKEGINETSLLLMKDSNNFEADQEMAQSYFRSVQQVFSKGSNLIYVLSFGISVGVYYTIPTFLSQLLPFTWSSRLKGWVGVFYQLAGILGAFESGRLVDLTQQHWNVCVALLFVGVLSLIVLGISVNHDSFSEDRKSLSFAAIGTVVGIVGSGLSLAAWNTVGMEFGTALTYPADEAAVAGIMECAAELMGYILVVVGGYLIQTSRVGFVSMLALVVTVSFALIGSNKSVSGRPK